MAGTYASVKLAPHLYFDIRAAWGQSSNDMTVDDDPGSFDTDRWLVKADLTGAFDHGPLHIGPTVGVSYIEERQKAYTTEGGTEVPERKAYLGRVHFGPSVAYRYEGSDGTVVEPHAAFLGIWDFASTGTLTLDGVTAASMELSATLKAGVRARVAAGTSLGVEISYHGLFALDVSRLCPVTVTPAADCRCGACLPFHNGASSPSGGTGCGIVSERLFSEVPTHLVSVTSSEALTAFYALSVPQQPVAIPLELRPPLLVDLRIVQAELALLLEDDLRHDQAHVALVVGWDDEPRSVTCGRLVGRGLLGAL